MKVKAAAKINLMLDIIKRLDNGYHSLWMVMQSVSCYDIVDIDKTKSKKIEIECDKKQLPSDETNIAFKAAKAFFDYTGIKNCGIKIKIEKNIPMSAGLAGGSADGAAVIFILNEIFSASLTEKEKCLIGVKVGADVPFSLTGGTALALNIGEVLAPLPAFTGYYIVLAKPDCGVSTLGAYAQYDKAVYIRHPDTAAMFDALSAGDSKRALRYVENVFEQVIEVHDRPYIKSTMRKYGSLAACMSGSGAAVFGVFKEKADAEKCVAELKKTLKEVFLTEPVKKSVEIIE